MELWKILRIAAWSCWGGIFLISIVAPESAALAAFFLLAYFPLRIASRVLKSKDPYVKRAKEEKKVQRKARRDIEARNQALDNRAVAAELIYSNEYSWPGPVGSTMVGGLMGGIPGAALGAYLGKKRATFSVQYASGRTGVERVDMNSKRYKELSELTK